MANGDRHTPGRVARGRGAFTILELLISILLIGIVLSLVIVGGLAVTRSARGAADRAAVSGIATGLAQFREEFGFIPPLVKDKATPAQVLTTAPGERRLVVYDLTNPADQARLRASTAVPTAGNPLVDNRYSTVSLAAYLAGGMDFPLSTSGEAIALDGSAGPSFYRPTRDGGFEIPADVRRGSSATTRRTGTVYQSLVNLTKASPRLRANPSTPEEVELIDAAGVPIRYYRWLTGREQPAGSGNFVVETIADLNVPAMVARDQSLAAFQYLPKRGERDLATNVKVKSATWAIVSAGPNGVFGDEAIGEIAQRLGKPVPANAADEARLRGVAEEDNVVEVGS
jgi:type II secretory pathway pseudopilin PulG